MENDWVFKLTFFVSFYLILRFSIIISWFNPESEIEKPNPLTGYVMVLPLILLFILGFFIIQWYFFLLFVLFCFFDPLMQISPRFYFQVIKPYSIRLVDNFFIILFLASYSIAFAFYYIYFYVI
jgi:hypothetical protein